MRADVPCLIERDVKESQLRVEINACAFSRAEASELTLESKKSRSVSFEGYSSDTEHLHLVGVISWLIFRITY